MLSGVGGFVGAFGLSSGSAGSLSGSPERKDQREQRKERRSARKERRSKRKERNGQRSLSSKLFWLLVTVARGLAFFVATYSLLSLVAFAAANTYNQNVWWIDLSLIPPILDLLLQICLVFSLYAFVVRIPRRFSTRICGAIPSAIFAFIALENTIVVYQTAYSGSIELGFPLPFSLFIFLGFVLLAFCILFSKRLVPASPRRSHIATVATMVASVCLIGILFPIGQMLCFGTTEYRSPVDAVVVFGAQVYPSGIPSPTLQDRLDKAIELYNEGRTKLIIMSGGIDIGGTSEAQAMRDYAIEQGVPLAAILIDEFGNNTQDTAANTVEMFKQLGIETVGAVSNFYHLARIKMEYLANGVDIVTIPADSEKSGPPWPQTFLREIPGWWSYWFSNLVRTDRNTG